MGEYIKYEKKGYKAYIIVDRQEKLNAFDTSMYKDVGKALDKAAADEEVRVVIMKGAGRAFSAGFDIDEETAGMPIMEEMAEIEDICNDNRWKIWRMRKAVIAQIHGFCLGGSLELVLPCDFIIGTEDVKLGEPEIQFGALSAYMMVPWLLNLRQAKNLMLTGDKITGKEAAEIGLITKAVPEDRLEAEVEELADKLIRISPPAFYLQKLMINRTYEIMGMNGAIDFCADMSVFARAVETDEVKQFNKIVGEQGMKAAFKWQKEFFDK